jgi:type IV secretion system protein VirB8
MSFAQFKKPEDKAKTDTKNWYSDRYQTVVVQRNLLFVTTLVSLAASLITTLLVYINIPLVTVEPFAIEVDRRSGIVQVVKPLSITASSQNERVNNYLLVSYLRAYETIGIADFPSSMQFIRISSDPSIFQNYVKTKNQYNKDSEAGKILAGNGKRTIAIKSVYYVQPNHAQIRFVSQDSLPGTGSREPIHYIANIKFEYREITLNVDEALLNPLGFFVTSYEVNREAI